MISCRARNGRGVNGKECVDIRIESRQKYLGCLGETSRSVEPHEERMSVLADGWINWRMCEASKDC